MSSDLEEINRLLEERAQKKEQLRNEQGQFYKKTVIDYAKEYGLDPKDHRIAAAALREVDNPEMEVLRIINSVGMRGPSDADMPSFVAKGRTMNKREALQKAYEAELKTTPQAKIASLKIKYRRLGLKDLY